jgi:hypothetical protein
MFRTRGGDEVAVEGAAGRREHDSRAPGRGRRAHRLDEVQRAEDVDARVEYGVVDAAADVDLGREMRDNVEPILAHQARRLRRDDVQFAELGTPGKVLPLPGGEVVDDDDRMPRREEAVGDVRADEARAARDQYSRHSAAPVAFENWAHQAAI